MTERRPPTAKPASSADCPCCDQSPDRDANVVTCFIAGVVARDQNVPIGEALCVKHGAIAKDCLSFVASHLRTDS